MWEREGRWERPFRDVDAHSWLRPEVAESLLAAFLAPDLSRWREREGGRERERERERKREERERERARARARVRVFVCV